VAVRGDASANNGIRNPNLAVYNSHEVAGHYAALNYLSACAQAPFGEYLRAGMDILDLGVGGGRTTVEACRAKNPKLEFHGAAALSIFANGSFAAVVFAFNGIDYVVPDENREKCLQSKSMVFGCSDCWEMTIRESAGVI
jgi:hypothetical protein